MSFRTTILLRISVAMTCCCSAYSQEPLEEHPAFRSLSTDCMPQSCSNGTKDGSRRNRVCDCDKECSTYVTCCIDSPYFTVTPRESHGTQALCTEVYGNSSKAYMISSCSPRSQTDDNIRELCENPQSADRDPLSVIPVTNPSSGKTYKNFFCSLCNFDHSGSVFWNVLLTFSLPKQNSLTPAEQENVIINRLEFDKSRDSWGIRNVSGGGDGDFTRVSVSADIPPTLRSFVKQCNNIEDSIVSQCATTWNDTRTKQMCESYLSPVRLFSSDEETTPSGYFRNPHCAICNYVISFEGADCDTGGSGYGGGHRRGYGGGHRGGYGGGYGGGHRGGHRGGYVPRVSFTFLLDINGPDGDRVGKIISCAKNEVYDTFFKKCRAMVCRMPGYVVKNGQCGPADD